MATYNIFTTGLSATLVLLVVQGNTAVAQSLTKPAKPTIELLSEIVAEVPAVSLITGRELTARDKIALPQDRQPTTPALPGVGEFIEMPGTNGEVEFTRITGPTSGSANQHSYARRSAIDPFNKYLILNGSLLSLNTFEALHTPPFTYEYVTANNTEDVFFGIQGNQIRRWNAASNQVDVIWTAPGGNVTIGQYEGSVSLDDKYMAVCWNNGSDVAVINLEKGVVVGQASSSSFEGAFNWLDVSPLGNYVLVGTSSGVYRYNLDFTNKLRLNAKSTGDAHSDILLDSDGNEIIAQEGNWGNGDITYTTLESNETFVLDLVNTDNQPGVAYPNSAAHISGEAHGVPGRVLVSLQNTSGMSSMFSADLRPEQTEIYNWGHSYSTADTYLSQAKASISNDGTMIVWTSNWMGGGQTYEFLARIKK